MCGSREVCDRATPQRFQRQSSAYMHYCPNGLAKFTVQLAPLTSVPSISAAATSIYRRLEKRYDARYGGFSGAPKFPQPSQTTHFLARYASLDLGDTNGKVKDDVERARDMAVDTMVKIFNGGIHDFVGGGLSRYSVDDHWHVPHCKYCIDRLAISI